MVELDGTDEFEAQMRGLEESLAGAQSVASTFSGELQQIRTTMSDTGREVRTLSNGISRGLRGAFEGLVFDGMKASDALRQVGESIIGSAYSAALNPVTKHVGQMAGAGIEALISGAMPFANGAPFSQGRVMPFARGGVVSGPTTFPMRGGTGLMGEAGPEAIMPLTRGSDGKLGVRSDGGGQPVTVVMNVTTPDATSFQRSQGQIASQVSRALGRGQRNR
ncbi:phage tail tape measure protein [Meridianimarinicoccus aquatilis]|uniref:Phage tail tape measure protein n=1 Tax=Meridianimarinicoccus aquatilis TaxID=2552766 RepID=A0A4R6B0Q4_9RHOB|nr:phage tail tape measure protein [Fluviibacterium aquatile]QIE42859.1 phage tail tape measure protein [Rhodobacteraceae bacterium SC52]TDL88043.1 phage tail tape measure protein [Fluviibacterium aquatile]